MKNLTENSWVTDATPEPNVIVGGLTHYGIHLYHYLAYPKSVWVDAATGNPATVKIFAWRLVNPKYKPGHLPQPDWANLPTRRFTTTDTPKGNIQ